MPTEASLSTCVRCGAAVSERHLPKHQAGQRCQAIAAKYAPFTINAAVRCKSSGWPGVVIGFVHRAGRAASPCLRVRFSTPRNVRDFNRFMGQIELLDPPEGQRSDSTGFVHVCNGDCEAARDARSTLSHVADALGLAPYGGAYNPEHLLPALRRALTNATSQADGINHAQ